MKFEKIFYIILSSLVITAFFLFTFVFSTSGNKSSENVKTIYFVDNISPALQKVIKNFNLKYKNQIKVETINLPFEKFSTNERKELLARYLRNKSDRIDIFSVDQIWVPRFAKWGRPLDKFFDKKERSIVLDKALKTCSFNQNLIAIPLYIDIALMYYRKDMLENTLGNSLSTKDLAESIEWEELIEISKKMNKQNPIFLFQGKDYEGLSCIFIEMLEGQKIEFIKNGKIKLNTPEINRTLQLLVDLINKYNISPADVVSSNEHNSYVNFVNNNGYFLRGWPGFINGELKRISNNPDFDKNLVRAPLPHFRGHSQASIYGGWNLMISKYSDKVNESIIFLKFLMSIESQKILFEEGGYLPINNTLYEDEKLIEKYSELTFYKELFKYGVNRPFLENYTQMSDILSFYLNQALKNELTVKDALKRAEEKINSENIFVK